MAGAWAAVNCWDRLHEDVARAIFLQIPGKQMLQCRLICSAWRCCVDSAITKIVLTPAMLPLNVAARFPQAAVVDLELAPRENALVLQTALRDLSLCMNLRSLTVHKSSCLMRPPEGLEHWLLHITAETNSGVIQLPETVTTLTNLTHLAFCDASSLGYKQIQLPAQMSHMTTLASLELDRTLIPAQLLGQITNLEALKMEGVANLAALAESATSLGRLKRLTVQLGAADLQPAGQLNWGIQRAPLTASNLHMLVAALTSLPHVDKLQALACSGAKLAAVPQCLAAATSLIHLDLSYNQLLVDGGSALFHIASLRTLVLKGNDLLMLPQQLTTLASLQHVDLSNNCLQVLPAALCTLSGLTHLSMRCNGLRHLPDQATLLTKLQHLDLACNMMTSPVSFLPASLTYLDVSRNHLTSFPIFSNQLPNLAYLDVLENWFPTVHASSVCLPSLRHLSMTNAMFDLMRGTTAAPLVCALTSLEIKAFKMELPWWAEELRFVAPHLQRLVLTGNVGMQVLPDAWLTLPSLQHLDLSNNALTELPAALSRLSGLTQLDASMNHLQELPEQLSRLTALQRLHLKQNYITRLHASMCHLPMLLQLDVSCNRLATLPENVSGLKALRLLNVAHNLGWQGLPQETLELPCLAMLLVSRNMQEDAVLPALSAAGVAVLIKRDW